MSGSVGLGPRVQSSGFRILGLGHHWSSDPDMAETHAKMVDRALPLNVKS